MGDVFGILRRRLIAAFYLKIRVLKIPNKFITDYILHDENRSEVRFPGSCRESMVRNRFRLVGEYPSMCLAADKTTLRLNTSAKQCFSFPIPMQSMVTLMESLQDCNWRFSGFRKQSQGTAR